MKKPFKYLTKSIFLFLVFSIIYSSLYGQEAELKKNAVYTTAGLVYSLTLCYEREIKAFENNRRLVLRGIGGYGVRIFEFEGPVGAIMIDAIRGSESKHLEYGAGLSIEIMPDIAINRDFKIWPAANIGYRYQKPGGHFVFRTGGGWPEAAYISLGFAF